MLIIGYVGFDDVVVSVVDQVGVQICGFFVKWNFNVFYQQCLIVGGVLYVVVLFQVMNVNFDLVEKLFVGGLYLVRVYDSGVLFGDLGVIVMVEWCQVLGVLVSG